MPDDEKVEIIVRVLGEELRLSLPGDGWTYEESKIAKNVSEGMTPAQIGAGLLEGDPDAWMAVLRVSYERAKKDWPAARIQGVNVSALLEEMHEQVREAINQLPPTNQNGSEPEEPSGSETPEAASPTSA